LTNRLQRIEPNPELISAARSGLRIALWWILYFLTAFAIFILIYLPFRRDPDGGGGLIFLVVIVSILTSGVAFALYRQIRDEREFLDLAGVDVNDIARRTLSSRHIRRIVLLFATSLLVLAMLFALGFYFNI
jgi:hypothetical protein